MLHNLMTTAKCIVSFVIRGPVAHELERKQLSRELLKSRVRNRRAVKNLSSTMNDLLLEVQGNRKHESDQLSSY